MVQCVIHTLIAIIVQRFQIANGVLCQVAQSHAFLTKSKQLIIIYSNQVNSSWWEKSSQCQKANNFIMFCPTSNLMNSSTFTEQLSLPAFGNSGASVPTNWFCSITIANQEEIAITITLSRLNVKFKKII